MCGKATTAHAASLPYVTINHIVNADQPSNLNPLRRGLDLTLSSTREITANLVIRREEHGVVYTSGELPNCLVKLLPVIKAPTFCAGGLTMSRSVLLQVRISAGKKARERTC